MTGSSVEQAILMRIQDDFPLCHAPYDALAQSLCCTRDEAFHTVQELRTAGIIRRIGASYAANKLGYTSALVAAEVDVHDLPMVVSRINRYPEVTHNYEREGAFRLWFTLIADSNIRMAEIVRQLQQDAGILAFHVLPAQRVFKIAVRFPLSAAGENTQPVPDNADESPITIDAVDKCIIARTCFDIDSSFHPFQHMAQELAMDEETLLARLQHYLRHGAMRRFGAMVRHQMAGMRGNALTVWNVPNTMVATVGKLFASNPAISHCYERPRFSGWPYNLYAMVHSKTMDDCRDIFEHLKATIKPATADFLPSKHEYKKISMVYFTEDTHGVMCGDSFPWME